MEHFTFSGGWAKIAMNEIRNGLEERRLDAYVGFLHVPDYGRPSLALDLLEAFRAPFVDRLTLRLINEKVLTADDFARRVNAPQPGSVVLVPVAFKRYFECYESAIREERKAAPAGIRRAFEGEVGKLRNWLREGMPFEPWREV